MMASPSTIPSTLHTLLRWICLALLTYWGGFALSAPLLGSDSQAYNIARLWLVHSDGLFGNQIWTTEAQVIFPWCFDAVHYPLIFAGWGLSLPSFLCLAGICWIVHRLASPVYGPARAWWFVLALLAMPNVVYQGTASKNDLAVVFGLACWVYARELWRLERRHLWLGLMATGLVFAAGAKSTGLMFLAGLGLWEAIGFRRTPRLLARWFAYLAAAGALLGGIEIYVNNVLNYETLLGPPDFVQSYRNPDGFGGTLANLIRYFFAHLSLGVEPWGIGLGWAHLQFENCRRVLGWLGLENAGLAGLVSPDSVSFLKSGREITSDYGLFGGLAMVASAGIATLGWSRPRAARLAALGGGTLVLDAAVIGWMPWNSRLLLLPFILFAVATVAWILEIARPSRVLSVLGLLLLGSGAVLAPLTSFNRRPVDLVDAWLHRETFSTAERPGMGVLLTALRAEVKSLHERDPAAGRPNLCFVAGRDSWIEMLFGRPEWTAVPLDGLDWWDRYAEREPSLKGPVYVLFLNYPAPRNPGGRFHLIGPMPGEWMTYLMKVDPPAARD